MFHKQHFTANTKSSAVKQLIFLTYARNCEFSCSGVNCQPCCGGGIMARQAVPATSAQSVRARTLQSVVTWNVNACFARRVSRLTFTQSDAAMPSTYSAAVQIISITDLKLLFLLSSQPQVYQKCYPTGLKIPTSHKTHSYVVNDANSYHSSCCITCWSTHYFVYIGFVWID